MVSPRKKVFDYRQLYQDSGRSKWLIMTLAILISIASIYYTNAIVLQLRERERHFIELTARSIEYAASEESQDLLFILQEFMIPNTSIPFILTDGASRPIDFRNINVDQDLSHRQQMEILQREVDKMRKEHGAIQIIFRNPVGEITDYQYIYYKNSKLLTQLRYYPYIQILIISIFGFLAYMAFSYSRTAEQNRVWVGLAKETAHQLGTPLSSLMAWLEYLKAQPQLQDHEIVTELEKDIQRLEMITARFSNIGSVPVLYHENVYEAIKNTVVYLQRRISSKVHIQIDAKPKDIEARINRPLFEWVIENMIKNSVDAMGGAGNIDIRIRRGVHDEVVVDISDTGKGIPKGSVNEIFKPGFTTKSRGWGLGLTLVKRIIENYHEGKIYVKSTEVNRGTTIRILLNS
jgi:two-component system, sporulation sensor kinase E